MSQRILVVGAGFAGMWSALAAARLLDQVGRTDIEIALIAPEPELHVRPRLYEPNPEAMKASLEAIFEATGIVYIQGWVQDIDVAKQQVSVVGKGPDAVPRTIGYDRLVLAAGSRVNSPPIAGLEEHAFNVDQIADAAKLQAHLHALSQRADTVARNTVVVAGAGFTGIETAAEMPSRLRHIFGQDARVNVVMVDRSAEVGPDLGPGPRPVILKALGELGISSQLGSGVASIDATGVTLESGEHIEAGTVIWTAGVRASALTERVPAERDPLGRLHVDQHLQVKGVATVYATGDCAYAAVDDAGHHATMSCQHAMNLGRSAGHNAAADLIGAPLLAYSQPKYVTCLDLGAWGAVYTEGWDRQVKLTGAEGKALKTQINTEWIYPPSGSRAEILQLADPSRIVVA